MDVKTLMQAIRDGKTVKDEYHNTLIYRISPANSKYPDYMVDGAMLISFNEMEPSKESVGIFILYDGKYKGLLKPENFEVRE